MKICDKYHRPYYTTVLMDMKPNMTHQGLEFVTEGNPQKWNLLIKRWLLMLSIVSTQ